MSISIHSKSILFDRIHVLRIRSKSKVPDSDPSRFHDSELAILHVRLDNGGTYDTMCIQNTSECLTKCYAPVEKLLDREFNTNIVPFPSKRHHLSHADLRNETVQRIVSETEKRCIDGCTERGCHLSFTVTIADHTWLADPDAQPVLYIHVKTPQHPDVQVTAIARWDLMSFLIYLCNCFSTWFGIDFLFILNIRTARFKMTKRRRKPDRRRLTVAERRQQTGRLQLPWYCGQSQRRTVPPITDTSLQAGANVLRPSCQVIRLLFNYKLSFS